MLLCLMGLRRTDVLDFVILRSVHTIVISGPEKHPYRQYNVDHLMHIGDIQRIVHDNVCCYSSHT